MKTFRHYVGDSFQNLNEAKMGNCFEVVGKAIMHNLMTMDEKEANEYEVVHAFVRGEGSLEGKRFVHAWIEHKGNVIDKANGNNITLSIKVYYNLGQVERNEKGAYAKYDRRTAQRNMGKYGHYGPWNEIDDSLHEGAIPDTKREIGKQKIRLSKDMKDILLDRGE